VVKENRHSPEEKINLKPHENKSAVPAGDGKIGFKSRSGGKKKKEGLNRRRRKT